LGSTYKRDFNGGKEKIVILIRGKYVEVRKNISRLVSTVKFMLTGQTEEDT
jgi:hypothetical protein